jgi:hypothetical protein
MWKEAIMADKLTATIKIQVPIAFTPDVEIVRSDEIAVNQDLVDCNT